MLLRLHFYAGLLVGPFILVAATSGALYALTPQLEKAVYAHELHAPVSATSLSLAEQVEAANAHTAGAGQIVAVRPAPRPGDTTRVMYSDPGLGPSETRAVLVDPATAEVRGDLTAYGTSGALPIRTWADQLHSNLHLGQKGRLYSELAASWLGIIALAGLGRWVIGRRRTRAPKDFVRPNRKAKGYRRILSWHASAGVWLLGGALFLSATGITWSQLGGGNIDQLRASLNWSTPAVSTDLTDDRAPIDEHSGHSGHTATGPSEETAHQAVLADPATFDAVLAVAEKISVNTGLVEIRPPSSPGTAWVVAEIQRSFPTEVDAVAIDGQSMRVTDRVDFADFGLAAKLTRWGIDTHMGSMLGLANQIVLFVVASGITAMVVLGYLMWWERRPSTPGAVVGKAPTRGALARAPWWGAAGVTAVGVGIGWFLPLLGYTLAAFVAVDLIVGVVQRRRSRAETIT